jgi:hypothetical protein
MPESRLRHRVTFMRKVFFRPLMVIAVVSPCSIFVLMSAFVLIRDDFVQPKNPEKWKLVVLFHGLPWWVWVIATLVLMMLVLVEGTFRYAHPHAEEEQPSNPEPAAPVETGAADNFFEGELRRKELNVRAQEIQQKQAAVAQADAPDVMLELNVVRDAYDSNESVPIVVYNATSEVAMNIQIDPIESGDWENSWLIIDGKRVPSCVNTRFRFDPVPNLSNDRVPAFPIPASTNILQENMFKVGGTVLGLWWFIDASISHLKHEARQRENLADDELATTMTWADPVDFPLRLTYWDRRRTRQWERVETLHYDPRTLRAYISHGQATETTEGRLSPYLAIEYVTATHTYVSESDPDHEEYEQLQEFLKFTNVSNEVIRKVKLAPFTVWGKEISAESVPTLIHGGEPAQKRVRGVEDQLKKANIGLRAFHKEPVGVPLTVTYYGQGDRQCVGRHALVYDEGNIWVEPLIDGAEVDWLDATEIVVTQDEADD